MSGFKRRETSLQKFYFDTVSASIKQNGRHKASRAFLGQTTLWGLFRDKVWGLQPPQSQDEVCNKLQCHRCAQLHSRTVVNLPHSGAARCCTLLDASVAIQGQISNAQGSQVGGGGARRGRISDNNCMLFQHTIHLHTHILSFRDN